MGRIACTFVAALSSVAFPRAARAGADEKAPLVESYLMEGKLADGEAASVARLKEDPKDSQARFGLGVARFLQGVERFTRSLSRAGLRQDAGGWSLSGNAPLPIKPVADPKPLTYPAARGILQDWVNDLGEVEATLAEIEDGDVKLPLHIGLIHLDLDGDGKAADSETLWRLYSRFNPRSGASEEAARRFVIAFDQGDVHWMRGYCRLLMAMGEFALALDGKEFFERTAHLYFKKVDSPYDFLLDGPKVGPDIGTDGIVDFVAAVHLLRFPLAEPKRMTAASGHLRGMIEQSRAMWKCILAETDDDREWIPSPKQKNGVVPNVRITEEMVAGWFTFLEEFEALLEGKKLIPFWRGNAGKGVNLRRFLKEPREIDLILWVQGTAALPYLENGDVVSAQVWRRLQRVFGGEFIGFAFWFN